MLRELGHAAIDAARVASRDLPVLVHLAAQLGVLHCLLEDELLMALPLVPMHDECPVLPAFSAGVIDVPGDVAEKPNPFAALAQLKKK